MGRLDETQPTARAAAGGNCRPGLGAGSAAPTTTLATPGEVPGALGASATASASAPTVTVRTDMVTAEVSALGGSIVRLELVHHKDSQDKTRGFVLLDNGTVHQYSAQSGLIGDGLPNHKTMFSLPEGEQVLKDGQDTLTLRLAAPPTADGLQVTKLLTFKRGSYEIQTGYEIANTGSAAVSPFAYFQFTRDGQAAESVQAMGVSTFTGPAVYRRREIPEGALRGHRRRQGQVCAQGEQRLDRHGAALLRERVAAAGRRPA